MKLINIMKINKNIGSAPEKVSLKKHFWNSSIDDQNRLHLREFPGFLFVHDLDEHCRNIQYIDREFSEAYLIAI